MPKTTQSNQRQAEVAGAANYANVTLEDKSEVRYKRFDCVLDGSNVAADVIELGTLPPGAVVLPSLSNIVVTDDMTSGDLTIDIGDATDPDRYCDGANCAAVGSVNFLNPAIPAGFTTPYSVAGADTLITATLATFTATIEAGAFSVLVAYRVI